ncbi:NUDIX domain-containing protein [Glycomyces sp. YM15]|uniref:NUDIX domain-containing protein n=1 Tax=Glycomyces sp. YM15 TaxID=2800446 RepID=UPI00196463E9|nr:NUDIX domain-containing protein [Glycomyces sp. YM15]
MTDPSPDQLRIEPLPRADEPRVSARAVAVDPGGRVLLVRHRADGREFHVLPGGRVEPGETAAEAAEREVLEETGIRVKVGELLWVREFLPDRHLGHPHHRTTMQQLQLYFRAEPTAEDATEATEPDGTQSAVVWHPLAAIAEIVLLPLGLAAPLAALGTGLAAPGPVYLGDLP